MWYYTTFSLVVEKLDWSKVDDQIDHVSTINNEHDWCLYDNGKWYEWESTMRNYSRLYPDLLFIVFWDWEESDDIWKAYINNWCMQYCKWEITYDEFDFNLLK